MPMACVECKELVFRTSLPPHEALVSIGCPTKTSSGVRSYLCQICGAALVFDFRSTSQPWRWRTAGRYRDAKPNSGETPSGSRQPEAESA
jgi:hypothetical protein